MSSDSITAIPAVPANSRAADACAVPAPADDRGADDRLTLGLDVGSTTVKLVLMPEQRAGEETPAPLMAEYRRHNADVRGEVTRLLSGAAERFPNAVVRGAVTGSAGLKDRKSVV